MSKFEEQPTSENRERIAKNEEGAEDVKKQLQEAMESGDADKIVELGGKMKGLKGQKEEFINQDMEEALKENAERDMDKSHEEALEMNKQFDEAKTLEKQTELKKQIQEAMASEDYDKITELGEQLKELTKGQKEEKTAKGKEELEELKLKDETESAAKAEEILKKINGEKGEEKIENVYGMSAEELGTLLESMGYMDAPLEANDPNFKQKYDEFIEKQKKYGQERVKLFDRVLSGKASEEEIQIAENHAKKVAMTGGGFFAHTPASWYTNDRLAEAMASTSEKKKKEIDELRKKYPKEELLKQYDKVGEDGHLHEYGYRSNFRPFSE